MNSVIFNLCLKFVVDNGKNLEIGRVSLVEMFLRKLFNLGEQ